MPRDVIFTDTCEAGRFIIAFLSFSLFSLSSPCDGNTILVEVHDFQLHECWMEPDKEKLFWQEMCFGESMSNCLTWCIFEFLTFPWLDAVDAGCSPISQRQHSSNLKKPRNFYKIFPIEMSMWSAILQKLLKVDIPRCHGFPFWSTWGVFFGTNDARSISEVVNVFKVGLEGIGISCGWPGGVSAPNWFTVFCRDVATARHHYGWPCASKPAAATTPRSCAGWL